MTNSHYRAEGLIERLKVALGPEDRLLAPRQLAALDQLHTRGLAATADLAQAADITEGQWVLDIGCGLGGPARFLAEACGCKVVGVDLSESFIEAAHYLTERTGQSGQVTFEVSSALVMPFPGGGFDAAMLLHVAMNIADRAALYREIHRVLKPGGRFVTYDVVAKEGEPLFPMPWARDRANSFLLSAAETVAAIGAAGFRSLLWQDETEAAKDWMATMKPPPTPNVSLAMGLDFPDLVANLGRNLRDGRVGVASGVFEAIA